MHLKSNSITEKLANLLLINLKLAIIETKKANDFRGVKNGVVVTYVENDIFEKFQAENIDDLNFIIEDLKSKNDLATLLHLTEAVKIGLPNQLDDFFKLIAPVLYQKENYRMLYYFSNKFGAINLLCKNSENNKEYTVTISDIMYVSNDPVYIYKTAKNISWADTNKLSKRIIELGNTSYMQKFLDEIPNLSNIYKEYLSRAINSYSNQQKTKIKI